jgi:serine/threonine protein phosphatase PrpC
VSGAEKFNRNVLFTCLGSPGKPMVDCQGPLRLERGDRMLLCSDGLWSSLTDEEIVARLALVELPLAECVLDLVEQALRKGGPRCDNVTVLAVEWEGEGELEANSAQELDESGFATTIQGGEAFESLDDVEIEREVREINEAIHRTRK